MRFETRQELGLRPAISRPRIPGPVESLTVHYNGPRVGIRFNDSHERCRAFWRGIQDFHMGASRGWHDIAYTMGPCIHGVLMAGRGAGVRTAANGTNHGNNVSYALMCLIGEGELPSSPMLTAIGEARVGLGVPRLRHHSHWKATACAGVPLNNFVRDNPFTGSRPTPVQPIPQEDDDMLVRIDGGDAVYQVVGMTLWPVGKAHVLGRPVKNIQGQEAEAFEIMSNHAGATFRRIGELVGTRGIRGTVVTPDAHVLAGLNAFLWANDAQKANLNTRQRYDA